MFIWDVHEDIYIEVLDEYGNIIAQSDNERLIPEHIEVDLARGQYFVAVHGQRSHAFNGAIYTINVETSGNDVGDASIKRCRSMPSLMEPRRMAILI
jgi:hypothetical protein